MLPYREHAGGRLGLRAHSGKRYREGAILRLLPDHLLKPLSMTQRLTGCRQMEIQLSGRREWQRCSFALPHTLCWEVTAVPVGRGPRGVVPFPGKALELS